MTRALRTALTLICFVLPASPAAAATFTVNTTADGHDTVPGNGVCAGGGGTCTLRAALGEAAALAGADTINLPAATYPLDGGLGQLVANSSVTVEGAGARGTVISGAAGHRVLTASGNLTLRGVTITGGSPASSTYIRGGGILVTAGDVTLERVTVRDNVVRSETNAGGGGVAATGGSLEILDSTISGNEAIGKSGNSAGGSGSGGGLSLAAPATIRRSTITSNVAQNFGAGQYASGGGIFAGDLAVTLDHVTLTHNSATSLADSSGFRQGGNLYVASGASVAMSGTIMAAGTASSGSNCFKYGTVTEPARNLSDTFDCLGASSLRGVDPKLGALADNGGPTNTRRPALDAPAVNGAAGCGARGADQRGNSVPAGPACDLGAIEIGADRSVTIQASKSAAAAGEDVTVIATVANAGADDATGESLTLELPAGAVATTATSTLGSCTAGAAVTCALGTLARGAGATVIATVRSDGGPLSITARRGGPIPDHSAANDAATVAVAGLGAATAVPGGPTSPQAPGAPAPGTPGVGQTGDRSAPLVRGLKLAGRATRRRGATLRFQVSEAATVRIAVERLVPGRRSGARCAAKGRGKRCTRVLKVTTRTAKVKAGAVTVKVPGTALRAGKLRFTVVATDAAGNASKSARVTGRVRSR